MATATMELVDASGSSSKKFNNPQLNNSNNKHNNSSQEQSPANNNNNFRSIASSISSMSSTSLNESSPGSGQLQPGSSSERLSLESSNNTSGPSRKMPIFIATNGGGQNEQPVPQTSSLLHSPNGSQLQPGLPPQQPPPPLSHQHQPPPSTPPAVLHQMQNPQIPPRFLSNGQGGPLPPFHPGMMGGGPPPDPQQMIPLQQQFSGGPGFGPPPHLAQFMPPFLNSPFARAQLQQRPPGIIPPQMAPHHLIGLGGLPGQSPMANPLLAGPGGLNLPHRIPSSDDACASIVHSLMDHRQGGDSEQFTKRAIESLVKKLRERKEELEALIFAVTTNGAQRTRCVTIQRTLDGRLQVAGKKGFPHVIYAKIWRWPDLHKNELRHVSTCQYAFDLKLDSVCVNPYHYERVVSPCPDLVPMGGSATNGEEPSPGQSSFQQQHRFDRSPNNSASPDSPTAQVASPPAIPVPQMQANGPPGVPMPGGIFSSPYIQHPATSRLNAPPSGVVISPPQPPGAGNVPNEDQQPPGGYATNSNAPSAFSAIQPSMGVMYNPPPMQTSVGSFKAKPPPLATPLELWCTINYFELNVQAGQPFKVPFACRTVIVDGFTDPNGVDRFCLGCLSNVHRDEVVERARPHIGKGVELRHDDAGDVWLKVLSEHSVFLESPYLDSQFGGRQAVHKIYSSAELKVFDLEYCYQQMHDQAQLVHLAKNMLRTTVKGNAPANQRLPPEIVSAPNIGVDDYQKHCVLRMSFVKGFGPDYNRKRIEDTPCWIEVKLHWPLKLLDQLLQPLDDPQYQAQNQPGLDPSPSNSSDLVSQPGSLYQN